MHAIDFGWSYEPALRITRGQVPFSDFVTTQPPLHEYTLALGMKLLGTSVWSYQIHLYFLWALSGLAAWWLARSLKLPRGASVGVALLALLLNPPFYMGHEYNYTAPSLVAVAIVWLVRAQEKSSPGAAAAAGALLGLALFAKQNVGLALIAGGLIALAISTTIHRRARLVGALCAGAAAVIAFGVLYFAAHAGFVEFIRQFLVDPATGKGGLTVLARAVPHLNLDFFGSARVPVAVGVGFLLIAIFAMTLRRAVRPDDPNDETWLRRWMWLLPVLAITVAAVSVLDNPTLARLSAESPFRIWFWSGMVAQVFAMLCYGVAALMAVRSWRSGNQVDLLLSSLLVFVVVAHAGGSWNYPFTMGAVAAPVAGRLLWQCGAARWVTRGAVALCAVLVVLHFSIDGWNIHAFHRLSRVPPGNAFSGLRTFPGVAEGLDEIARRITPRVTGRRTLWLTNPFPLAAFGGELVKADTAIDAGAYSPRPEQALMDGWRADPPDVVVYAGPLLLPPTSTAFSSASIDRWLTSSYMLAETLHWGGLTVWTRKER